MYYTGRDMKLSHEGMGINESDWAAFMGHLNATLDTFQVPQRERDEVVALIESTKPDLVEAQRFSEASSVAGGAHVLTLAAAPILAGLSNSLEPRRLYRVHMSWLSLAIMFCLMRFWFPGTLARS